MKNTAAIAWASNETAHTRFVSGDTVSTVRVQAGNRFFSACAVLALLLAGACTALADSPGYKVDPGVAKDDKAGGNATVTIEIDWSKGEDKHRKKQAPLKGEVPVKKGESEEQVANDIFNAMTMGNGDFARQVRANFEVKQPSKDKDGNWTVSFAPKAKSVYVDDTKVSGNKTELSIDGGVVAQTTHHPVGMFTINLPNGKATAADNFVIYLWDPFGSTQPDGFRLLSYDGLTAADIETKIAALMEEDNYTVEIKGGTVYVTGPNDSLGIGYSESTASTAVISTDACSSPEPTSLLLLGSGVLGLSGFLRRRIHMTS